MREAWEGWTNGPENTRIRGITRKKNNRVKTSRDKICSGKKIEVNAQLASAKEVEPVKRVNQKEVNQKFYCKERSRILTFYDKKIRQSI